MFHQLLPIIFRELAGRSEKPTALRLPCQRRSHDFAHYMEPLQIIKGDKAPYIEITNEK